MLVRFSYIYKKFDNHVDIYNVFAYKQTQESPCTEEVK